jgi:threonine dehydratase
MVRRSRLPLGLYLHPALWSCQRIRFRQRCDPSGFIFAVFSRKSVVKVAATRGYGAEVVFCEPNIQSRTETTERIAKERGMTIVHPFDYWPTIYGQGMCTYVTAYYWKKTHGLNCSDRRLFTGTCVMEVLEQVTEPQFVFVPVGGGGLTAGSCLAAEGMLLLLSSLISTPAAHGYAAFGHGTRVVACEPAAADDAFRSLQAGAPLGHAGPVTTIADGLRTSIGALTFSVLQHRVAEIVCVTEQEIMEVLISFVRSFHMIDGAKNDGRR